MFGARRYSYAPGHRSFVVNGGRGETCGNSGVMTFVVNYAGTGFQKDLGERTSGIAERMTSFNPDQTWKKANVGSP